MHQPTRVAQIHENHEPAIHDLAMRLNAGLSRIKPVPADGLRVPAAAAGGTTTSQEKRNEMGNTGSQRHALWV
jgi:hypothetical protein